LLSTFSAILNRPRRKLFIFQAIISLFLRRFTLYL
jgi:hypothetical protein